MKKKKIIITVSVLGVLLIAAGTFLFTKVNMNKKQIFVQSLSAFEKFSNLLPIEENTKKEIDTINELTKKFTSQDGVERRFLILLQNNMELRPGGGFLGQYAVLKIKNGEITSTYIEDANLLDQRIKAKINPPYPFEKMMSIKKWKFRDSNFSPDFPTNVEKAEYFYRLSGGNSNFDGVIAVNADVLSHVLKITGPIKVPGYPGEYNSENVVLDLEEQVEKAYLFDESLDTQNRKAIMKKMGEIIIEKLVNLRNIPRISDLVLEELRNKNVMLNFDDENLQSLIAEVHWDGAIARGWDNDYLMMVDANMGAFKSDYYIKREVEYELDLTTEKPTATLYITYKHTATHGDWRTSDYHSYLRVYVPEGSNLLEREMVSYPNIQEDFNRTYFGFTVHTLINRETRAKIKYELPEDIKDDYRLLIQKQSGVGDVPIAIKIKTDKKEYFEESVLKNDLKFEIK